MSKPLRQAAALKDLSRRLQENTEAARALTRNEITRLRADFSVFIQKIHDRLDKLEGRKPFRAFCRDHGEFTMEAEALQHDTLCPNRLIAPVVSVDVDDGKQQEVQ
jgi:hypothetical protein